MRGWIKITIDHNDRLGRMMIIISKLIILFFRSWTFLLTQEAGG